MEQLIVSRHPDMDFLQQFRAGRRVGTPEIAIRTADNGACLRKIVESYSTPFPILRWDFVGGVDYINEAGMEAMRELPDGCGIGNPAEMIASMTRLPADTMLFCFNLGPFLTDPNVWQGLANARDEFKATHRTVVMLGPDFTFPPELANDVLVIDEPLPDEGELSMIAHRSYMAARMEAKEEEIARVARSLRGLAAFPAEQAIFESFEGGNGDRTMNFHSLRQRVNGMIAQVKGLSVYDGPESFESIRGNAALIDYLRLFPAGNRPPSLVIHCDEIEKAVNTMSQGDTSNVSQDFLGQFLQFISEEDIRCLMFVGIPGTAKTLMAKSFGNECGCPTVRFDPGAMQGSLVGESQARARAAFSTLRAIGGKNMVMVSTSNNINALPPELISRQWAVFYFDMPTPEEQAGIWEYHRAKQGIAPQDTVPARATNWTGREIERCCKAAAELNCTLETAARYIVPVALSGRDRIEQLRREANGVYLSTSVDGTYRLPAKTQDGRMIGKEE